MARWSWWPGLPSLGPMYELWTIDLTAEQKPLDQADLLVCLADEGDSGAVVLANRVGRPVSLQDARLCKRDHEKRYTDVGGRRLVLTQWRARFDDPGAGRAPPDPLCEPLPPCEATPDVWDRLADWIDGDRDAFEE